MQDAISSMTSSDSRDDTHTNESHSSNQKPRRRPSFHIETSSDEEEDEPESSV